MEKLLPKAGLVDVECSSIRVQRTLIWSWASQSLEELMPERQSRGEEVLHYLEASTFAIITRLGPAQLNNSKYEDAYARVSCSTQVSRWTHLRLRPIALWYQGSCIVGVVAELDSDGEVSMRSHRTQPCLRLASLVIDCRSEGCKSTVKLQQSDDHVSAVCHASRH